MTPLPYHSPAPLLAMRTPQVPPHLLRRIPSTYYQCSRRVNLAGIPQKLLLTLHQ